MISCHLRLKCGIGVGMFLRYGYSKETNKDGNGESGRVCGGRWRTERVLTGFLKVVVWGGNGKRAGGDQRSDRICGSITVHTSINLTHYNSG